ncbi:adenine-specific DNA methylase [Microbacterium trichothecenolyticum]|uniref:N-6 DNA methylase n=1 Tax=Microbacterium trichothecenolyticum TaxID=69370 RepID=UPI00285D8794|nr:N-6 DNA methylase [Microbacterium trichothecenolyticum]MDR7184628.1 adenine-specific DNA methylase [Microbacterium trichothecenolyticum]
MTFAERHLADTPELRKARGAFFTPAELVDYIARWAVRSPADSVFEPSAGDAEFLVAAARRLQSLGVSRPTVHGVEIHDHSAQVGRARVRDVGGEGQILTSDFFAVDPAPVHTAVIGNPPYVRYQDWTGAARVRSREAALRAGVALTGLASSWAAFTIQSTLFLTAGGRMGLVLPAELLSVNYAAPVRRYLFDKFSSVELVLFDEQVFPEAEADVVLLLADGFGHGPAKHATIRQARNAAALLDVLPTLDWAPADPAAKWTGAGLVPVDATEPLARLTREGHFGVLEAWGDTTLGAVTGNNKYFALSPQRVKELGLSRRDLIRLSPPGSSHLRGLALSADALTRLGNKGRETYLFRPAQPLSAAATAYIESGHRAGVDQAYKCRVRKVWHQVPIVPPADLLLTCMNADTPRLTTNLAGAHHLNSVHGVYLSEQLRDLGRELLPLASLNSLTLLNAEIVGRAYGGGILKLEPREADRWAMPSPEFLKDRSARLRSIRDQVARKLQVGRLLDAVAAVDHAMFVEPGILTTAQLDAVRNAHGELTRRRTMRAAKRG